MTKAGCFCSRARSRRLALSAREQPILVRRQSRCLAARFGRREGLARQRRVVRARGLDLLKASPHVSLAPARQGNLPAQGQRRLAFEDRAAIFGQNPAVAILRVLRDEIRRVELMENAPPFGRFELLAHAKCRQKVMAVPPDRFGRPPGEEIARDAPKKTAPRCGEWPTSLFARRSRH